MLEWTGERFIPDADPSVCGARIHYEHLHRYAFASRFVDGKDVLDLASGEGYGTFLLSRKARKVIGVEIDHDAITHSSTRYAKENIEFREGSILNIPIDGERLFDVIICFEALEHVSEHDTLMGEIKRLLRDDGILIISTPNKQAYTNDIQFHNPYHKKELYLSEFEYLIRQHFDNIVLLGQRVMTGSSIFPVSKTGVTDSSSEFIIKLTGNQFSFAGKDEITPLYYIAVASRSRTSGVGIGRSYLIDKSETETNTFIEKFNRCTESIRTLDVQMKEATLSIASLKRDLESRELDLESQELDLESLKRDLAAKDRQVREQATHIQGLSQQQRNLEMKLSSIENSTVWQLTMKFHTRVIERFLPPNSRRRGYYNLGIKAGNILCHQGYKELIRQYHERKRSKLSEREHPPRVRDKMAILPVEEIEIERIVFPRCSGTPDVSIVIPVHNQIQYTLNCLDSIARNTTGSYEIVVVDDASSDSTAQLIGRVRNLTLVRNEQNMGLIRSCNAGAAVCSGRNILFLNNDTLVTRDWLSPLLEVMQDETVGAAGAKLVYPDGKLQEAGAIIWNDATGWNYGRLDDPEKPEYNFIRPVDYCSGAALLVRAEIFTKAGGFSERYLPAYYEDADLCFTIRQMGYRVMYQPRSEVVHFEGVSNGTDIGLGIKRNQVVNREKFLKKWNEVLQKEHAEPDSAKVFLSRTHSIGKTILVIDQYVPFFDRDAGSYRMSQILKILAELGHRVTFIGDNFSQFDPYDSVMQQSGVEVLYSPYIRSIEEHLAQSGRYYDIVILSRPHIVEKYIAPVRNHCRNARIIYDTVDLQFIRESRRADVQQNPSLKKKTDEIKRWELQLARACDMTLVVSGDERQVLKNEDPSLDVRVLSLIHDVKIPKKSFSDRSGILFLGAFLHNPNADGVLWFIREIFPKIHADIPDIKFYVVGDRPTEEILSLSSGNIIVTGYVEDVTDYFENCRVFVAPLRYGAGVKGKINHSMSYGLPVVTTTVGAEGLGLANNENVLIADDPIEFAEKVLRLYRSGELWENLSKNSLNHIRKNFSYDITKGKIQEMIDSINR